MHFLHTYGLSWTSFSDFDKKKFIYIYKLNKFITNYIQYACMCLYFRAEGMALPCLDGMRLRSFFFLI